MSSEVAPRLSFGKLPLKVVEFSCAVVAALFGRGRRAAAKPHDDHRSERSGESDLHTGAWVQGLALGAWCASGQIFDDAIEQRLHADSVALARMVSFTRFSASRTCGSFVASSTPTTIDSTIFREVEACLFFQIAMLPALHHAVDLVGERDE